MLKDKYLWSKINAFFIKRRQIELPRYAYKNFPHYIYIYIYIIKLYNHLLSFNN